MRGNPCQAILLIQLGWSELPPAVLRGGWANTRKLEWSRDLRLGPGSAAAAAASGPRYTPYTIHYTLYTVHHTLYTTSLNPRCFIVFSYGWYSLIYNLNITFKSSPNFLYFYDVVYIIVNYPHAWRIHWMNRKYHDTRSYFKQTTTTLQCFVLFAYYHQ